MQLLWHALNLPILCYGALLLDYYHLKIPLPGSKNLELTRRKDPRINRQETLLAALRSTDSSFTSMPNQALIQIVGAPFQEQENLD